MPFEIPKSWEWTTVREISKSILYGVSESAKTIGKYKLLRITDIQENYVNWNTVPFTDFNENKAQDYLLNEGDILFARTGATVGKSYLVKEIKEKAIYASYLIRVQTYNVFLPEYVKCFFESGYYWEQIRIGAVGVGQPNVNGTILGKLNIPIPPIEEQKRIVVELSRWLNLIDIIESGMVGLKSAVKQVKAKILDLAIHGKLVPQDPTDEPASELLHRINPTAEISSDNAQYGKIPEGWCMVKGKDLFKPMKSIKPSGITFKYIDIDSIDNKCNKIKETKTVETSKAPSRASRYTEKYDVVFSMVRPYLRNIAIVEENNCIASTGFYICSPYDYMYPQFCYVLMLSNYVVDGLNTFMKGDNSPSINKGNVDNWTFPLPPLVEQRRIVAKIEELFAQLNLIEAEL